MSIPSPAMKQSQSSQMAPKCRRTSLVAPPRISPTDPHLGRQTAALACRSHAHQFALAQSGRAASSRSSPDKKIRRCIYRSVHALRADIMDFITRHNAEQMDQNPPTPRLPSNGSAPTILKPSHRNDREFLVQDPRGNCGLPPSGRRKSARTMPSAIAGEFLLQIECASKNCNLRSHPAAAWVAPGLDGPN
jgi:hypothetical protein